MPVTSSVMQVMPFTNLVSQPINVPSGQMPLWTTRMLGYPSIVTTQVLTGGMNYTMLSSSIRPLVQSMLQVISNTIGMTSYPPECFLVANICLLANSAIPFSWNWRIVLDNTMTKSPRISALMVQFISDLPLTTYRFTWMLVLFT